MAARSSWTAQGPISDDLLWFQPQHRSRDIFSSGEDVEDAMRIRRADLFFWECMADDEGYATQEVMYFIRLMGFGLIAKVGYMEYDHHLLTALAERWRPETHSFHLSVGEASITLQDVEVLLGLRVDGAPVTGTEAYDPDIDGYLSRLLGFVPEKTSKTGIKLTSIKAHLQGLQGTEITDEEDALQRARCMLAFLLAGCFFPDHSQNKIDLFTLRLLEDPERCGCFSWGSALLAYTYRALCDSARYGEKNSLMCGLLVQSWAWTRISKVRPRNRPGHELPPPDSPLAAK
jgi:hypothetical protein